MGDKVGSGSIKYQKPGFLFSLYQRLLQRMGNKRFYPEIQRIDRSLNLGRSDPFNSPSNGMALRALIDLTGFVLKRLYLKLFLVEQWYLLFNLDDDFPNAFKGFRKIIPPLDRFWADPQFIQKENRCYVFVEEYFYSKRKGHISVIEIDEMGNHKDSVPVLEEAYHLSYPFTFKHEDKYYMVPETSVNKTIDLYECVDFPYKWHFVMHLMENVIAVDTSLFYYSNKWWLFTAMPEKGTSLPMVKLFLFWSEDLKTNAWKPHPQNPIVADIATARPAGRIFVWNGKIYRPSQDGSESYGYSLDLNEVNLISENEYSEKRALSIRPDWDKQVKGTHTYSREGQVTVIDVFRRMPRIFTLEVKR